MRVTGRVLVAIFVLLALGSAGPGWGQVRNIGGSTMVSMTPDPIPIGAAQLCFTVNVVTPDSEYMDRFEVDLPDTWTVVTVASNSSPVANGCSAAMPPVTGTDAGNVVYWQSAGLLPTDCGAWYGNSGGGVFAFCVDVTVPASTGAPWSFPAVITGDGWGAEPHSASGTFGPTVPVEIQSFSVE